VCLHMDSVKGGFDESLLDDQEGGHHGGFGQKHFLGTEQLWYSRTMNEITSWWAYSVML